MASPGSDPFSGTNTRNVLQNILSPKLVANATGGYDAKVDLINIDNVYMNGNIFGTAFSPPYVTNDLIVATGDGANGTIATSRDGQNWVSANIPRNSSIVDVLYNGSYWVGVGQSQSSNFFNSLDGLTWTSVGSSSPFSVVNCIAWNGQYWLAGGMSNLANSSILRSIDGRNWSTTTYFFDQCFKIAWNGEYWVAIGQGSNGTIAISYNGNTWTAPTGTNANFFSTGRGYSIAWNGSYWLAIGQSSLGTIAISYDGQNWAPTNNNFFVNGFGRAASWNGIFWVAVGRGDNGTIGYSFDGLSWSASTVNFFRTPSGTGTGNDITWTGSFWIAVGGGSNGSIGLAIDGTDPSAWTAPTGTNSNFFTNFGTTVTSKNVWLYPKPSTLRDATTRIATFLSNNFGVAI
jgi:hypothetical protein